MGLLAIVASSAFLLFPGPIVSAGQNDAGSGQDAGNSFETALAVAAGSYQAWMDSTDTNDWYAFSATPGQIIRVSMVPPNATDFNLELYDPGGNLSAASLFGTGSGEWTEYVAGTGGLWRARMTQKAGIGLYAFTVSVSDQNDGASGGDAGNDFLSATGMSLPADFGGELGAADIQDWFKVTLQPGVVVRASLSARPDADLDLSLYDPEGALKVQSSFGPAAMEDVTYIADVAGEWRIRIGAKGTDVTSYRVVAWSSAQNDARSGGDAGNEFVTATTLTSGVWSGLIGQGDILDWYKIWVDAGMYLNAESDAPASNNVDLAVANPSGQEVATSTFGYGSHDAVSVFAGQSGYWFVRVGGVGDPSSYRLSVSVATVPSITDAESSGDAPDNFNAALPLMPGFYAGSLPYGDVEDWYKTHVEVGGLVTVGVRGAPTDPLNKFYVALWDPTGVQRVEKQADYTSGYQTTVSFSADMSGDWRVRVRPYSWDTGGYHFVLTADPQNDGGLEGDAPGNFNAAVFVEPGAYVGLLPAGDSEDWFKLSASSGQVLSVGVRGAPTDPLNKFYVALWDPTGVQRVEKQADYTSGYQTTVSFSADMSGDWRVRVRPYSWDTGGYRMAMLISNQSDASSHGDAPDNLNSALLVAQGSYGGFLPAGDAEDWYRVQLVTGQTVVVGARRASAVPLNSFSVALWDPTGVRRVEKQADYTSGYQTTVSFSADMSGDWRVRVRPYSTSYTGGYLFGIAVHDQTAPPTLPLAPRDLHASPGDGRITLSWAAPSSDGGSPITNYRIYRGTGPGAETLLTAVGNITTYTDMGLTNGQTYYYQVSAVNAVGEGPRSSEVSATPANLPGAPRSVVASPADGRVTISWQAPASDGGSPITGYRVYRGTSPGGAALLIEAGNVLAYTDATVTNGVTYYYQVSAVNAVGEGPRSPEVTATPAASPDTTLPTIAITSPTTGATLTSTTVTVRGTASDNVAIEKVEVSLDGTTWVLATGTTSWSASLTLREGANTITARATDTSGNMATASVVVTVDLAPPAPKGAPLLVLGLVGAAVAIAALVPAVYLLRRRKRGRAGPPAEQSPPIQ